MTGKKTEPPTALLNAKIRAYKINSVIKKKKYYANLFYKNKNSKTKQHPKLNSKGSYSVFLQYFFFGAFYGDKHFQVSIYFSAGTTYSLMKRIL